MFISTVVLLSACLSASPPEASPQAAVPEEALKIEAPSASAAAKQRPYRLRFDAFGDGVTTAFGAVAWTTTEVVSKRILSAENCRWCDRQGEVDALNGLDRAGRLLRWEVEAQHTADLLSNISGFGLVPMSVLALDVYLANANGAFVEAPADLVMILQASVLAILFNQGVKFLAGRQRPFAHELSAEERVAVRDPSDNNLSFFSGHATFVFSMTVAAGTVAELRGYEGRWMIWAVGLPLAAATSYLRMAADKHYLTDILVGTAVGSAFGVAVPLLLHPRQGRLGEAAATAEVRLVPGLGGASLVGRF